MSSVDELDEGVTEVEDVAESIIKMLSRGRSDAYGGGNGDKYDDDWGGEGGGITGGVFYRNGKVISS